MILRYSCTLCFQKVVQATIYLITTRENLTNNIRKILVRKKTRLPQIELLLLKSQKIHQITLFNYVFFKLRASSHFQY